MLNFQDIQTRINNATDEYKRNIGDITLIAVSKKQPDDRIEQALTHGHRVFGENRVQEAQNRWAARRAQLPDLKLHLIGPLQTNKASDAIALFDVIETLDRPKLARALAKEIQKQGKHVSCLIQVNTGEENQKSGVLPKDLKELYQIATKECGLNITGLMCIPPIGDTSGLHFGFLKKLAQDYALPHLSMGMSNDFEAAISFGATHIRVGSALFGQRPIS